MNFKFVFTLFISISVVFNSFTQSIDKGFKFLEKQKIDKAKEVFDKVYQKNNKDVLANYGYYLIHKKSNAFEKAYSYILVSEQELSKKSGQKITEDDISLTFQEAKHHREELETIIFQQAVNKDDLNPIILFIQNYPKAHNINAAITKRNEVAFQKVRKTNTVIGYNDFLKKYPEAEQRSEVENLRNTLIFKGVTDKNTIQAYEEFIEMYPTSNEVYQAVKNRDKLIFQEVLEKNSVEALMEFIQKYPNSEQIEHAKKIQLDRSYIASLQDEGREQQEKIEEKEHKIEAKRIELAAQRQQTFFYTVLFILALVLLILAIVAYVGKQKANQKILEQKRLIEQSQKEIIQKNQEILDSIIYAKFIQTAILPSTKRIKNHFQDAFVFYRPKDIVSGDFYWYGQVENKQIIAAVDCTGHGVPGAFMSMIGNTLLNQIVLRDKITQPAQILFELRKEIIKALSQSHIEDEKKDTRKDGMDIALCTIENNKIQFAGAFNPMILVKKGEGIQVKADRKPIGEYMDKNHEPFVNHEYTLEKGDAVYLFTDGYADQFGGTQDKKIGSKVFREMLIEISPKSAQEQEEYLEKYIKEWMKKTPQVDDMLIIGMKF